MKRTDVGRRCLQGAAAVLVFLVAAPVFAGEVLTRGADLWQTATGFSYSSFKSEPIPAGFFCAGSPAFTGIVQLNGKPLATEPAGALGQIDTIVRRLDDAVLNERGEASTRIQLLALSLAGVKPIDTGCGLYDVTASLTGEQPITTMRILKTSQGGGTYVAPLELNVKLVFTPVAGNGARRELTHRISMGPGSRSVWSYSNPVLAGQGTVRVDTNGDGIPDTVLPAASNFRAGVAPGAVPVRLSSQQFSQIAEPTCAYTSCHCDPTSTNPYQSAAGCDHLHCVVVQIPGPCPDSPSPSPD
jgi:hypothetical protein